MQPLTLFFPHYTFKVLPPIYCPFLFFFFNDTATTEIYTLSLHDALPICRNIYRHEPAAACSWYVLFLTDRKSTRLNSSHQINLVCRLLLEKKKKRPRVKSLTVLAVQDKGVRDYV